MNSNLETLKQLLKSHDWYFEMSDDYRVWTRGQSEHRAIVALVQVCAKDHAPEVEQLIEEYVPSRFKSWIKNELDYIVNIYRQKGKKS